MGIKCKTIKLDSIVIEKVKSKYYIGISYITKDVNFCSSLWNHIVDDVFGNNMTYYEFKRILKTYNGRFDKVCRVCFNSQEEAEVFKDYLESLLIMNKIME